MNRIETPKVGKEGIEINHHSILNSINKAEGVCREYADYFENGFDDHEFSGHPLPFQQRVIEVFADLHDAICLNTWMMDIQEMDRIVKVIQEIIFMGIDESELNRQFHNIMEVINIYKKRMTYHSTIMDKSLPN